MTDPAIRNAALDQYNQYISARATHPVLAGKLLLSAVHLDPSIAIAWHDMGVVLFDQGHRDCAIAAYRRALECEQDGSPGCLTGEKRGRCMVNLGQALFHSGRIDEAIAASRLAAGMDSNPSFALTNLSLAQSVGGDVSQSLHSAMCAYEADPNVYARMALAFALFYERRWIEALRHYEARFEYRQPQYLSYPYPRWSGETLEGKTLYLAAEQGLGDTLSFFRFVPLALRYGQEKTILHVQPESLRLFRWLASGWGNVDVLPLGTGLPKADAWCPMTSLPLALGLTDAEFENAKSPPIAWHGLPALRYEWKATNRKIHIGIAWRGSAANDIDRWRNIPLHFFLELYRVPGVQLYSLQKADGTKELESMQGSGLIRDLSPFITDVTDTLEIMRGLDLVVTVESSPGHMAGLVDCECWIPYSYHGADWRIGRKERGSLWYPRHRIFKQGPDASWGPVFERIVEALRERVSP